MFFGNIYYTAKLLNKKVVLYDNNQYANNFLSTIKRTALFYVTFVTN